MITVEDSCGENLRGAWAITFFYLRRVFTSGGGDERRKTRPHGEGHEEVGVKSGKKNGQEGV